MVNVDRLKLLADRLESHPPEQFDIRYWHCGTACCAVGLACTIPEFREAGLELIGDGKNEDYAPSFRGMNPWLSVQAFFGLDARQSQWLFDRAVYGISEDRKVEPEDVAFRIRCLIADQRAKLAEAVPA